MTKYLLQSSAIIVCLFFVFFINNCEATESANQLKRALQIEQLGLQRKILDVMDLYEDFSKSSVERVRKLNELLGETSYSEAVEMFRSGQTPYKLIPARTEWRSLAAHDQHRWGLRIWLDRQARDDRLGEIERKTEDIDARIRIGDVLTPQDMEEINRLLATEAEIPDVSQPTTADQVESANRSNEWLERTMSNIRRERE